MFVGVRKFGILKKASYFTQLNSKGLLDDIIVKKFYPCGLLFKSCRCSFVETWSMMLRFHMTHKDIVK